MTPLSPDMIDGVLRAALIAVDRSHPACISGQRIGNWFIHDGYVFYVDHLGHVVNEDAHAHLARLLDA